MASTAARFELTQRTRLVNGRLLVPLVPGAIATGLSVWTIDQSPILESPSFTAFSRGLYVALTIAAGAYVWWRHAGSRLGPLILAVGFLYALSAFNASGNAVWFTIGMTFWAAFTVVIVYVYLCFPRGHLGSRLERWFFRCYMVTITVLWGLILATAETLPTGGRFIKCGANCPSNGLRFIDSSESVGHGLTAAFTAITTVGLLGVALIVFAKARSATRLRRHAIVPLSVVIIAMIVDFVLYRLLSPSFPGTETAFAVVTLGVSVGVPIAIVIGQQRASSYAQRSAGRLVATTQGNPVLPTHMESLLRDSLGDPTLALVLWSSEQGGYVDVAGQPVELPDGERGRAVTPVTRGGEPVAAIIHDPALDERPEVMDGLSATSLMLLENTRLIEELQASRARIVTAGDQERLRLERDLHDGAQQRLMAIQIKLALARDIAGADELAARLDEIGADAATAVEELRALAHGIYPTVLRERGLADGLSSFARTATLPVQVVDKGVGRYSPEVEGAIYFCVTEAIQNAGKHAGPAAQVTVLLERAGDDLVFSISDDGHGFDSRTQQDGVGLVSMRDRIGAVGGRLEIVSSSGRGSAVRGTVPAP
jgi:signal transduction histidine kinase